MSEFTPEHALLLAAGFTEEELDALPMSDALDLYELAHVELICTEPTARDRVYMRRRLNARRNL